MTEQSAKPARVYLSPPETSARDRQLLLDAFDSNWIAPLGPQVDAFEAEFAECVGVRHAVAVSSGTAALHLALVVAGVGPGDRVITPTFTFVATANAIRQAGATPVFADCSDETWTLDPQLVDRVADECEREGRPAAAVMPVDLFGQCADYNALRQICDRRGLTLIADAAESLGATHRGRSAGAQADISGFSFNGNKMITTSSGGMIVTDNRSWADRARSLAAQARAPGVGYHHEEAGYNYRLSNLLAALGRGQLETLARRVARRREIFQRYEQCLSDLPGVFFMPDALYGEGSRWLTCMVLDPDASGVDPERIRLALEAENIESRPLWKPLHLQPAYAGRVATRLPEACVAESLWRRGLCLPSGSSLSASDQDRVLAIVHSVFEAGASAARDTAA